MSSIVIRGGLKIPGRDAALRNGLVARVGSAASGLLERRSCVGLAAPTQPTCLRALVGFAKRTQHTDEIHARPVGLGSRSITQQKARTKAERKKTPGHVPLRLCWVR